MRITRPARSPHRSLQLAGINFPSDAVGTTESVTGMIILNPAVSHE
jgi:hypothetical protein